MGVRMIDNFKFRSIELRSIVMNWSFLVNGSLVMNWNFLVSYWIFMMNRDLFNNRCIIMDNWSFVMRNMFIFLNYRSLVDYWGFMVICNFMFDRYFRLHCMDFFLVCSCLNMFFRSLNYMFLRCLFFSM